MILDRREHIWFTVYCMAVQNPVGYASHEAEAKADAALRAFDARFPSGEPVDVEHDR